MHHIWVVIYVLVLHILLKYSIKVSWEITTFPGEIYQTQLYLKFLFFSGLIFHKLELIFVCFHCNFQLKAWEPLASHMFKYYSSEGKVFSNTSVTIPKGNPQCMCNSSERKGFSHVSVNRCEGEIILAVGSQWTLQCHTSKQTSHRRVKNLAAPTPDKKNLSRDRFIYGLLGKEFPWVEIREISSLAIGAATGTSEFLCSGIDVYW